MRSLTLLLLPHTGSLCILIPPPPNVGDTLMWQTVGNRSETQSIPDSVASPPRGSESLTGSWVRSHQAQLEILI